MSEHKAQERFQQKMGEKAKELLSALAAEKGDQFALCVHDFSQTIFNGRALASLIRDSQDIPPHMKQSAQMPLQQLTGKAFEAARLFNGYNEEQAQEAMQAAFKYVDEMDKLLEGPQLLVPEEKKIILS